MNFHYLKKLQGWYFCNLCSIPVSLSRRSKNHLVTPGFQNTFKLTATFRFQPKTYTEKAENLQAFWIFNPFYILTSKAYWHMCMLCHTFWKAGRHLGINKRHKYICPFWLYCCASFPRWGRQQLACVNSVSLYKSVRGVFIPQAAIIMVPTYTFRNDIRSPFTFIFSKVAIGPEDLQTCPCLRSLLVPTAEVISPKPSKA